MADLYFENAATKKRYKIVSFDREKGTVTMIGAHGVPFTEKYSKERFQEMGYALVQGTDAPAPPPPPQPVAAEVAA